MPTILAIRLHPVKPITGDELTNYLNGLSIAAHEERSEEWVALPVENMSRHNGQLAGEEEPV
jgi:hypothetical protein